jgi:O-antigen ligase
MYNLGNLGWFILAFLILRVPFGTPLIGELSNYAFVIVFLLTLLDVIKWFPKTNKKAQGVYLLMIGMCFVLFFSRYLNKDAINIHVFLSLLSQLSLINLFSFSIRDKLWERLKLIDYVLISYIFINLYTLILYPKGLDVQLKNAVWFLGAKNMLIRTFLPALTINFIVTSHFKGHLSIWNYLYYAMCLLSVILGGNSVTSMVAILFFCGGIIFLSRLSTYVVFNVFYVCLAFLVVSFVLVSFNVLPNFSTYLDNYFGKDATMAGRTFIWEYSLVRIYESPYIGYGYHTGEEWRDILDLVSEIHNASHAHNFFLFCLLQGGLIYSIGLLVLFFIISNFKRKEKSRKNISILTLMYLCFFIEGISESITFAPLWFPLFGLYIVLQENSVKETLRYVYTK